MKSLIIALLTFGSLSAFADGKVLIECKGFLKGTGPYNNNQVLVQIKKSTNPNYPLDSWTTVPNYLTLINPIVNNRVTPYGRELSRYSTTGEVMFKIILAKETTPTNALLDFHTNPRLGYTSKMICDHN